MAYQQTRKLANDLQRFWQSNTVCQQLNYKTNNEILNVVSLINKIADFEHTGFAGDLESFFEQQSDKTPNQERSSRGISLTENFDFNESDNDSKEGIEEYPRRVEVMSSDGQLKHVYLPVPKSQAARAEREQSRGGTFGKTVFLSAGHSDRDPGAVNETLKIREEELAQDLRNRVAKQLRFLGIKVLMDGPENENWERDRAISLASSINGPKIDIHLNAGPQKATGIEVFSDPQDRSFAQRLAAAVQAVLHTPLRGDKGWKPDTDSQHGSKGLAWIRRLSNSFLMEIGFISNIADMNFYLSNLPNGVPVRDALAESLAKTIAQSL